MVSRDFAALTAARAVRARQLAVRYPAAEEALRFCAAIAEFQAVVPTQAPLDALQALRRLVVDVGTPLLREAAQALDEGAALAALEAYRDGGDTRTLPGFFARVLLMPTLAAGKPDATPGSDPDRCPRCGHRPQVACLHPEGHGTVLSMQCAACLLEWPYDRHRCPACRQSNQREIAYFGTDAYPHVQVRACEPCRRYLQVVNMEVDPAAVPDIDEVAALPLDLWAQERGYRKISLNLIGV